MNSNLPIKAENNIFEKIKKFFRRFFYNKIQENDINEEMLLKNEDFEEGKNISEENLKSQFDKFIEVEVDNSFQKEIEREKFFEKVTKNYDLLNSLNIEQLEKLVAYGEKIIEKNDNIIAEKKQRILKLNQNN